MGRFLFRPVYFFAALSHFLWIVCLDKSVPRGSFIWLASVLEQRTWLSDYCYWLHNLVLARRIFWFVVYPRIAIIAETWEREQGGDLNYCFYRKQCGLFVVLLPSSQFEWTYFGFVRKTFSLVHNPHTATPVELLVLASQVMFAKSWEDRKGELALVNVPF